MKYLVGYCQAVALVIGVVGIGFTQIPFECNGKMFRTIEKDDGSELQEFSFNDNTSNASFERRAFFPRKKINAICFRPQDNLIYGVLLGEPYGLCRIDGANNLTRLTDLPLPPQLLFVAGDISPDGRYLVLLGFSNYEPNNVLALVDLEDKDYQTTLLPVAITGRAKSISCADIAFHPTTGILYGYNHKDHRLMTIDIENQRIDNTVFAEADQRIGVVPTIFFDATGRLFGMGADEKYLGHRILIEFNLSDGQIIQHQPFGIEGNQDGCSCPYQIHVLNKISNRRNYRCTEVQFDVVIINRTPFDQSEILLRDTFPKGLTIKKINNNPFGGRVISGVGSNILSIDGLLIPQGTDTIKVTLDVDSKILPGFYQNQVALHNLDLLSQNQSKILLSDDPETDQYNDPTGFFINHLNIDLGGDQLVLCKGSQLLIDPQILGAETYLWNTGDETPTLLIDEPGFYSLTVNTYCEEAYGRVTVVEDDLSVNITPDISLEEGEQAILRATVQSESPIAYVLWSEEPGEPTLRCRTCPEAEISANRENKYSVRVRNQNGCQQNANIRLNLHGFEYYAPNVFSPNQDGQNDVFYLQGIRDYSIEEFHIYGPVGQHSLQSKKWSSKYTIFWLGWDE